MLVRSQHIESVYVVGSHDEFIEAIGDKVADLLEKNPERGFTNVKNVNHAFAFDADGNVHWSALLVMEMAPVAEDDAGVLDDEPSVDFRVERDDGPVDFGID